MVMPRSVPFLTGGSWSHSYYSMNFQWDKVKKLYFDTSSFPFLELNFELESLKVLVLCCICSVQCSLISAFAQVFVEAFVVVHRCLVCEKR